MNKIECPVCKRMVKTVSRDSLARPGTVVEIIERHNATFADGTIDDRYLCAWSGADVKDKEKRA